MKGIFKKAGMYALVVLVSLTSFTGLGDTLSVNASTITETETITMSYKMPDTVGEGFGVEPQNYDEVRDLIRKPKVGDNALRTGWSALLFECVDDTEANIIKPEDRAEVLMDKSSVGANDVLTFNPAVKGESVWVFAGMTDIMDAESGKRLGNGYKYKSAGGQYITAIQPGNL